MIYDFFNQISFKWPLFFGLLLLIPVLIFQYYKKKGGDKNTLHISSLKGVRPTKNIKVRLRNLPFWLRIVALISIIFALARPQNRFTQTHQEGEGIDIMLAIDVSGSMSAQDFTPNRIEAAKKVAIDFVNHRPTDRIGVVTFAGESFTQCPLTTNHYIVTAQIQNIRIGFLADGTAIGDGLAKSIERLKESKAKSKVVILLTDGVNNTGLIDPSYAKEIAKNFGIKVYTIGMGTDLKSGQSSEGSMDDGNHASFNENLLKEIADETGGKYFNASDNNDLESIYKDINKMEKSKVEITTFNKYTEKFYPFVFLAIGLLFLELLLKFTLLKKFP